MAIKLLHPSKFVFAKFVCFFISFNLLVMMLSCDH